MLCVDNLFTGGTQNPRIFNTYGPRMHRDDGRVVSNFIVQALCGHDITIFGDGSQTRSFCYVDDLIGALLALMDTGAGLTGPINLGNPVECTMLELAQKVIALTGSRSRIVFRPLPGDDPRQRRPDIRLARQRLGWAPRVALEDGLARTIAYFERVLAEGAVRIDGARSRAGAGMRDTAPPAPVPARTGAAGRNAEA